MQALCVGVYRWKERLSNGLTSRPDRVGDGSPGRERGWGGRMRGERKNVGARGRDVGTEAPPQGRG